MEWTENDADRGRLAKEGTAGKASVAAPVSRLRSPRLEGSAHGVESFLSGPRHRSDGPAECGIIYSRPARAKVVEEGVRTTEAVLLMLVPLMLLRDRCAGSIDTLDEDKPRVALASATLPT